MAAVGAEAVAVGIDDLAGPIRQVRVAAQELALALAAEEAEVLALGTARYLQLRLRRQLPHAGLGQRGER